MFITFNVFASKILSYLIQHTINPWSTVRKQSRKAFYLTVDNLKKKKVLSCLLKYDEKFSIN